MGINLGDVFPNFDAVTTQGTFKFHDFVGKGWAILFSHPADFTPVCTTELGAASKMVKDFEGLGVKLIALSCDSVEDHKGWVKDIEHFNKDSKEFSFPIISDPKRELAVKLGMLDPDEKDKAGLPLTCRAVFVIGPDCKLKLSMLYPATTGRNFDEIYRVVKSLQLTVNHKVATPANWKSGDRCMVVPSVTAEEASKLFSKVEIADMPSKKGYMRFTPDPTTTASKK